MSEKGITSITPIENIQMVENAVQKDVEIKSNKNNHENDNMTINENQYETSLATNYINI